MAFLVAQPSPCGKLFCETLGPAAPEQSFSPVASSFHEDDEPIVPFAFDTPSPDDMAKAARSRKTGTGAGTGVGKPSKSMLPKVRQPRVRKNGTIAG